MKKLILALILLMLSSPVWAVPDADHDADRGQADFPVLTAIADDDWLLLVDISNSNRFSKILKSNFRAAIGLGTSDNPTWNSGNFTGGNIAASNTQVTKKWITGIQYTADVTSVIHGGKHFICSTTHTASAAGATGDEPGVGDTWSTKWKYAGDAVHPYGDNTIYSQDSEPAACLTGDMWVDTNGTSGQRIYTCESTNTWVAQAGGSGTDDQTAAEVAFTPNGSIAATDVQAAIQEVRDEAGSGGMVYPGAGIPLSTGSAWGTSYTLDTDIVTGVSASDDTLPSAKAVDTALDAKVAGPASATDTAIALFDGTTGKLIKNSVCTISATGVISCTVADGSRYATLPNNTSGNIPSAATVVNGFYSYINELWAVEGSAAASKVLLENDVDDTAGGTNGSTKPVTSNVVNDHLSDTTTHGTTGNVVGTSDTQTLTNKTIDVEGTGNAITIVDKVWFAAAGCNNTTATSFYDLPTTGAPAPACITGTNTQKGVLDFNDGAPDESGQVSLALPSDWSGNIDLKYKWLAAATSGSVVWGVQTSCVADAETDDPSWNTASTTTDAAKGTTLQANDASMTTITVTGCAAGELMHLRFFRDADNGSDDMTGDARLVGAELTLRRAQ